MQSRKRRRLLMQEADMAKPLDPKAIEAERQTSSRAERREQKTPPDAG